MLEQFHNPSDDAIKALLQRVRTIAVIGLSPQPSRPSYLVASNLQGFGYRIVPVRPAVTEVLGEKAYASLRDVPEKIDMVDVFRAPEYVDAIVDNCIELRRKALAASGVPACGVCLPGGGSAAQTHPWVLWLQDGVVNEPAALRAQAAGITVVMDRCAYRDYVHFFGRVPRAAPV